MQEGCSEGRVVTVRGKWRPSKCFNYRTVIKKGLVQTQISYLV